MAGKLKSALPGSQYCLPSLSDAMDKSSDRLNMLQRNNQNLSAELARVREENQKLDKNLADMRAKQTEYDDTIAGVDRIWQQLTKDVEYIANRIK